MKKEKIKTPSEKLKKPALESWENEGGEIPNVPQPDSIPPAIPQAAPAKRKSKENSRHEPYAPRDGSA